jgi:uncharacterized protein (DUF302 family)
LPLRTKKEELIVSYHISKKVDISYEEALVRVTEELKKEGFGIITEIDIKAVLKKKLDVDFRNYKILGACNPNYAYKALQSEDKIGTMLPCNVIVQQHNDGTVEISAIDPIASMQAIENKDLGIIATEVQGKLRKAVENV